METTFSTSMYVGFVDVLCAISAAAAASRNWVDAARGMKRADLVPAHTQGSSAWSPPL
jgi:hypothetical protein